MKNETNTLLLNGNPVFSANAYSYVGNDPINSIDPLGLAAYRQPPPYYQGGLINGVLLLCQTTYCERATQREAVEFWQNCGRNKPSNVVWVTGDYGCLSGNRDCGAWCTYCVKAEDTPDAEDKCRMSSDPEKCKNSMPDTKNDGQPPWEIRGTPYLIQGILGTRSRIEKRIRVMSPKFHVPEIPCPRNSKMFDW